jgi:uncharacterized protein YeaO (DUF488 family)
MEVVFLILPIRYPVFSRIFDKIKKNASAKGILPQKKCFLEPFMTIELKRAYEPPAASDGLRVLIDRIWPRGISKEDAKLDEWAREVAPSSELRKWFGHDPDKWDEFRKRYFRELDNKRDLLDSLLQKVRGKRVTLVFGARDEVHNNAVALKEYLQKRLGD